MSDRFQAISLTLARWTLAVVSIMHGLANTFGLFGGPGLTQFVTAMSGRVAIAPEITAYVVAIGQLVGGLCLLLGPFARLAAGIMLAFVVAGVVVGARYQAFFDTQGGIEYALLLAVPCYVVAAHGVGLFAIEIKAKKPPKKK